MQSIKFKKAEPLSKGSSGDLAPLAHLSLVMLGMGEAIFHGEKMPGLKAMQKADIPLVREKIPYLSNDRIMYPDIEAARRMIVEGKIFDAARIQN